MKNIGRYAPLGLLMPWILAGIMLLAFVVPAFGGPGDDPGDGKIVTGDAGADGSLKISIKCKKADGTVEDIDLTVQINVETHDVNGNGTVEADEKAWAIEAAIDDLTPACFTASWGNLPDRVILDAGDGCEITELEITDDDTKETIGDKITPRPPKKAKGKASFEGASQGGTASLAVGSVSATVNTTGLTTSQIMDTLATQLSAQGVSALFDGTEIYIMEDLTELLSGGNTDAGLALNLKVSVPEIGPTLTVWGLIVLAVLLMASAIFVFFRRKRVTVSP